MKNQYENISSMHIYSLSAYRIQDVQALTDINRDLFTNKFTKEDPLIHNKTYGVIQNSGVRRRTGKRPPESTAPLPKFKPVKDETQNSAGASGNSKATTAASLKKEQSSITTATPAKHPNLKRDTSDIFKSFAKAKSKPKLERNDTDTSTNADSPSQSGQEDTKMTDADSEGDSEEEALFLDTGTRKPGKKRSSEDGNAGKDKEERAAKLRKMMDSDDEEMTNVEETNGTKNPISKGSQDDVPDEDTGKDVAWSDSDSEQKASAKKRGAVSEELSGTDNAEPKRRRGKRKVMKKRTMKDEDGYLVTKEEAVWESFSEDEPVSQSQPKSSLPPKTQSQPKSSAGSSKAAGKGPAKGGNIMSFFGKK